MYSAYFFLPQVGTVPLYGYSSTLWAILFTAGLGSVITRTWGAVLAGTRYGSPELSRSSTVSMVFSYLIAMRVESSVLLYPKDRTLPKKSQVKSKIALDLLNPLLCKNQLDGRLSSIITTVMREKSGNHAIQYFRNKDTGCSTSSRTLVGLTFIFAVPKSA